jgi:O-antigen/teichoic acid export membrane protein
MSASRLLLNSGSNFAARIVSAVFNLASVPVFVRVLGGDAFGVVAFVVALQGFLSILDLGLCATLSREVARESNAERRRDLVRTLASVYWSMSAVVLAVMAAAAFGASHFWLKLADLTATEVWWSLSIAGAAVAMRWPTALYVSALQGLERHVEANLWSSSFSVVRIGGGVAVALWWKPSLEAVFAWQLAVSAVEVVSLRRLARKHLSTGSAASGVFRKEIVTSLWRTALGFSAVGSLGTIGANIDRVLLARFLPVSELGVYSSITTLTGVLTVIGVAVSSAAFPRLARAAGSEIVKGPLAVELKRTLGIILWLTVPVGLLFVFGHEALLRLWLGRTDGRSEIVLLVLVVATFLNAVANPFYTATMAGGFSGFLLRLNLVTLVLLVPFYLIALPRWGAGAAAFGVAIQNGIQVAAVVWRYRQVFPDFRWCADRLGEAAFSASVIGTIVVSADRWSESDWIVLLAGGAGTAMLVAVLSLRLPEVMELWRRREVAR